MYESKRRYGRQPDQVVLDLGLVAALLRESTCKRDNREPARG